jgi:hypothetical protein
MKWTLVLSFCLIGCAQRDLKQDEQVMFALGAYTYCMANSSSVSEEIGKEYCDKIALYYYKTVGGE